MTNGRAALRILVAVAAGTFALMATMPAAADYASREYNRGYHDCVSGQHDREEHDHAYWQGCHAAERESGSAGAEWPHHATVGIPNVTGMGPVQALTAMQSRGYRNVGTSAVGGMIVGIYFNPVTQECVQLTSAYNRVVDARDNITDRRCR
jgi:hypothetical protein